MPQNSALQNLMKGSGIILIGTAIGKFLGLVGQILIIRSLPPSEFGQIMLAFTIVSISSTLFLIGIPDGITRLVAAENDHDSGYVIVGLLIASGAGIIGGAVIILLRNDISNIMQEPKLASLLIVFAIYIIFKPLSSSFVGSLRGYEMYQSSVITERILPVVLGLGVILTAKVIGHQYTGAILYFLLPPIVISVVGCAILASGQSFKANKNFDIISRYRELISFSWPLALESGFIVMMANLDIIFIGYYLSTSSVGLYRSVQPIASSLLMLLTAVVFVYLPIATKAYTNNRFDELDSIYSISTKWIINLSLPPILLLIFFSKDIISILYGNSYTPASIALSILAVSAFLRIFVGPNGATIKAINRTKVDLISSIFGVIVNIILNIVLIPNYGIMGAALATTIGYTAYNGIEVFVIYTEVGIHPFAWESLIPTSLTVVGVGIFSYLGTSLVLNIYGLIFAGLIISLVHLFSIFVAGGFQEEDILLIEAIENRIGVSPITMYLRNKVR